MTMSSRGEPAHAQSRPAGRFTKGSGRINPGVPMAFRARVFSADDLRRAHTRIAHEIVERNHGTADLVLVGLYTRGIAVARRLADAIEQNEGVRVPVGSLDVTFFRDDIGLRDINPLGPTEVPVDISGRTVVLTDDVLYTGRTIRSALDALTELGRAQSVQLAVLVDRGHRELPIRADFVGKNLPTKLAEDVRVRLVETDGVEEDGVELWGPEVIAPEHGGPASTAEVSE